MFTMAGSGVGLFWRTCQIGEEPARVEGNLLDLRDISNLPNKRFVCLLWHVLENLPEPARTCQIGEEPARVEGNLLDLRDISNLPNKRFACL